MRNLNPKHEEFWFDTYERVDRTGQPSRFVSEAKALGRWFDVYAFRLGELGDHRVAILFNDITARKQAEREREELLDQLQNANRHKDEFLAMLAHELRNPLAPIRNAAQILRLTGNHDEAVVSASEILDRQVGQMVRLVDDLLDVSRVSRGKIELRRERVELGAIASHSAEDIRPLATQLNLELQVTLPSYPIFAEVDPARIAQVIGNLLTNACKFTDAGGHISLTLAQEGEQAVIRVRDTGIGLDAKQLPHIFDMFMQVDTSLERSTSGLGIGLTSVKTLVEMHGGTVMVHSGGTGQGSEFAVSLPIARTGDKKTSKPRITETEQCPPRRILVVDDNDDSARSLAMLLKLTGNETKTAHDGMEAISAAEEFRPEIMLLDIGLPKMNGYEVCRSIRQQPWGRSLTIIALTGWGQDEDRQKSKDAGFNGHLVKPVDFVALKELLGREPATWLNRS